MGNIGGPVCSLPNNFPDMENESSYSNEFQGSSLSTPDDKGKKIENGAEEVCVWNAVNIIYY